MSAQIEFIDDQLAALEAEWQTERARYLKRGKDGQLREPDGGPSIPRLIALMVGSVVGIAFISASSLPIYFSYLGLVPFAYGTFQLMVGSSKAESFERGRTAYESRKGALERQRASLSASA